MSRVFHPLFVPCYLGLIVFLVYYSFQLARSEEAKNSTASAESSSSPLKYLGVALVAFGFVSVQYVEWSKKFQHRPYTREQVAEHNTMEKGVWLIVKGDVFDVTPFVKKHPPGAAKILARAGTDATKFYEFHLDSTKHFWRRSKIGWVVDKHEDV